MANPTKKETQNQLRDELKNHEAIQDSLKQEAEWYKSIGDSETARAKAAEQISERQRMINDLIANQNKLTIKQSDELEKLQALQKKEILAEKSITAELEKQQKTRTNINAAVNEATKTIKEGVKYLMDQDKIIKGTILNLGMSGAKAEMMRGSFEQSAGMVARLGGSLEDVQNIMQGYADETGRARVLSSQMVEDIEAIGKGTGLGVEGATKLGAQFEYMGFNAKSTMDYVQGIVETSERMGVNTTKVLKNLNDNFKKLNTFTFIKGSKAIADMTMNAEKTKVSMSTALNVAESTRSLEKVIDLGAQLQVMGGEFAKMDPLQWLYTARNEPDKMTEKISEMTKGLYTFRKMSDGTFEKFISPVDVDRLTSVASSLGIAKEEIFQIAERRLDMDKMNQDMMGMGLTKREKELVQGAAVFNKDTGKYQVMLGTEMKDISSMTAAQARSFIKESKSLKDRALEAQTFEGAFKATINELKSALLPMLKVINGVLTFIRPAVIAITKLFTEGPFAWAKVAALFIVAGTGLKIGGMFLQSKLEGLVGKLTSGGIKNAIGKTAVGGGGGGLGGALGGGKPGAGSGMLKGGAGIGAAALGIGAGIGVAAVGISKLADAMSKLTPEQAKSLESIVKSLSKMMIIGIGAATAIALIGGSSEAVLPGLLGFGAAVLMIGGGIAIAALGISKMAEGFGHMFTAVKGAGEDMKKAAVGIAEVVYALGAATLSIPGAIAMSLAIGRIAKHADELFKVGEAFRQINAVMSGNKEDYQAVAQAVESISKINTKGGSAFSGLANILSKPLKVEFANKEVAVVSNITMNIDGHKFHESTNTGAYVRNNFAEAKAGQTGH
jgi:hypothetical protein